MLISPDWTIRWSRYWTLRLPVRAFLARVETEGQHIPSSFAKSASAKIITSAVPFCVDLAQTVDMTFIDNKPPLGRLAARQVPGPGIQGNCEPPKRRLIPGRF